MKSLVLFLLIAVIEYPLLAQNMSEQYKKIIKSDRIEDIRAALPSLTEPIERSRAQLHLAVRLYNRANKTPDEKADMIRYFREGLGERKDFSLEMLTARIELASLLISEGGSPEAISLLEEVIEANPEHIYHDEFSPEYLRKISEVDFRLQRQGITSDSPIHKRAVERRLNTSKRNIMDRYESIRESAVGTLSEEVYRKSGSKGLKELLRKYKDRPEVQKAITEVISDKLSNSNR